jgi:hypothetical protein
MSPPRPTEADVNATRLIAMPKVKIDQLKEGMTVKADVKNLDDMLLIPAGCELTPKHIKILNAWGVVEVNVESSDAIEEAPNPVAKLPPEVVAKLEAEIRSRFWKFNENDPLQKETFRLALYRRARLGSNP